MHNGGAGYLSARLLVGDLCCHGLKVRGGGSAAHMLLLYNTSFYRFFYSNMKGKFFFGFLKRDLLYFSSYVDPESIP